jgi:hypothetical protein
MPSTVYKGDLAEVSFAPETGMMIRDGTDVSMAITDTTGNITTITFSARLNTTLFDSGVKLLYPKNMLVGSQLIWEKTTGAIDDGDLPDTGNGGRIFTIVENDGTTIKITPSMISGVGALGTGDTMHILPYKTPPMDISMTHTAGGERVLTDQFLGIATALTLPETKVDLKRFHVVGLGRDAAIQVPGKLITEGGSFEVAMHSARWLKYCLGHELINSTFASDSTTALDDIAYAGQSHIDVSDKAPGSSTIEIGDYVEIRGATAVPIVSDHEPDGGTWDGALTDDVFDEALPHEVRRIVGVSTVDDILYLDEPLCYRHESGEVVEIRALDSAATNPVAITNGTITDPVTRILYSRTTQPSFSLEVSQRRRDIDSDQTSVDGGVGDSKELTRVFRGCKVTDWTMTTDNDAALRLSVNFNAALCYTDTGRLEGTAITRYAAHRMFDDTASTDIKRLESGIGKGSQKPFMFYNGSIKLAGQQVAQVLSMTLTGQTGMQSFHTINGHFQSNDITVPVAQQQVPFAGARNASIMVEGQTTYEMTMEIAVDDPLFYHKMRSGTEFSVSGEGVSTAPNQIRIIFEKNLTGSTAAADSEKMVILIDDYYIVEAPLGIPEDKGVVKSTLKIMPKSIKVLTRDSIAKY